MEIPKSAEIFEWLSKGNFISANAVDSDIRNYYHILEENFDNLQALYQQVGFSLEAGNNFFYLSKINESRQTVETKLEKARRWIDLMAFFTTFNQGFTRGFRFSPNDILQQVELNLDLKEQLEAFRQKNKKTDNYRDALDEMLRQMNGEGFIELENSLSQTYKVLDAYHYLEQMVRGIFIAEAEEENNQNEQKQS